MSNPFDLSGMGGLGALLGGFQERMENMRAKAEATVVEGTAGGGAVKVRMNGNFVVVSVSIAEAAMGDREMLEDLFKVAAGDATDKVRDELSRNFKDLTGGLPLPPGLGF